MSCPDCGVEHDCRLVQSIDGRTAGSDKQRLLAGELNLMTCGCGNRVQLAATVLYLADGFLCQVCPGDDAEMERAAELIRSVGASGIRRVVPSLNALVEKVKVFDAGLDDWAVEMTKVLLLASLAEPDLDRVLLFAAVDRDEEVLRWLRFDPPALPFGSAAGAQVPAGDPSGPQAVASPLSTYVKLRERAGPANDELRIDRAWAVEAVRRMVADAN